MTMYYRRHNNSVNLVPFKKLALVVGLVVLVFFSGKTFFNTASSLFIPMTGPFLHFGASIHDGINNLFPFLKTNGALIEENKMLKEALSDANGKLLTYNLLADENKALKESFHRGTGFAPLLAGILARPSRSPYDTLILDVGLRDGVALGDTVSVFETVAIGTITGVSTKLSKVTLFSAPGEKTNVRLEGAHVPVEIVGQGGGMFLFTVPREIAVTRGAMLALPGIRQQIVGVVTNVDAPSNNPFQIVTAKLPANIFEIERVFVSQGYGPFQTGLDAAKTEKTAGN